MNLAIGASFHGDAGYYKTAYQKSTSVTAADVARVGQRISTKGRVVLSVVPNGKADEASKLTQSKKVTGAEDTPRPEVK